MYDGTAVMSMYVLTHLHAVRHVDVAPFESSRHVVGFLRDGWKDVSGGRERWREDITDRWTVSVLRGE